MQLDVLRQHIKLVGAVLQCERGVDTLLEKAQRVGYPGESAVTCPI